MDLDAQEKLFWSQAGPVKREPETAQTPLKATEVAKRQRLGPQDKGKSKGKGSKGKGKGFSRPGPPSSGGMAMANEWMEGYTNGFGGQLTSPWNTTQDVMTSATDHEWLTHRVNTLSQMVLRQEQAIASMRQDTVVYLFIRSGQEGMIPVLCEAADKWRKMKEEKPDQLTYSLKIAMFKQLLISLHQRLSETYKNNEAMTRAAKLNWVDDQKHWNIAIGGGQHCPTDVNGGLASSARTVAESRQRGHSAAVQVGASTHDGGHGGVDSVSDLHLTETRGRALVEHSESMDRPGLLAHAGLSSTPGSASLRQSDPANLESDVSVIPSLKALLQLVLHNPTNLCYLHSTIMAVHWVMLQVRLHDARAPLPPQVLTMLCPPSTSQTSATGPVQVLQSLPWLLMLRTWPHLHQQHDVAEFAMYLLPRFSPMGMNGCWEARNYSPDGVITLDTGTLETPLPMQCSSPLRGGVPRPEPSMHCARLLQPCACSYSALAHQVKQLARMFVRSKG